MIASVGRGNIYSLSCQFYYTYYKCEYGGHDQSKKLLRKYVDLIVKCFWGKSQKSFPGDGRVETLGKLRSSLFITRGGSDQNRMVENTGKGGPIFHLFCGSRKWMTDPLFVVHVAITVREFSCKPMIYSKGTAATHGINKTNFRVSVIYFTRNQLTFTSLSDGKN